MLSREFVTAGRAVFTIEVPEAFRDGGKKPHYTYRVKYFSAKRGLPEGWKVQLLTGPDNTKSYTDMGWLDPDTGALKTVKRNFGYANALLSKVLQRVWKGQCAEVEKHGFLIHHIGFCGRCGRDLTVPESIERGIGPECIKHIPGLAMTLLDDAELEKATRALEKLLGGS